MTTFLEFVRKLPALPKGDTTDLAREHWNVLVGDHLIGLYCKYYDKRLSHLRGVDIDYVNRKAEDGLSLHLAYDWVFNNGCIAHASVLALNGTPVCAWRKQGRDNDLDALMLLEPNIAERLARWVFELVGRHVPMAVQEPILDVNAWLWDGNEHLAPAGSDDTFFYTVKNPEALAPISQLVTNYSYVSSIEGGLLPLYDLGAVQELRGQGHEGVVAMAHTLGGPRSVDARNLVHSVLPEEHVRGQDLEALQKRLALDDYWFIESCSAQGQGWACVVGVHRRGRVYFQWHILYWSEKNRHKVVEWHHRVGERQPGPLGVDVISSMEWQLGE